MKLRRIERVVLGLAVMVLLVALIGPWLSDRRTRATLQRQDSHIVALESKLDSASTLAQGTKAKVEELAAAPPEARDTKLAELKAFTEATEAVADPEVVSVPGPAGERGVSGPPPDPAVVRAYVAEETANYFASHPELRGLPGLTGPRGDPGTSADPALVADSLKADPSFIAATRGPQGDRGPAGQDGSPGPAGQPGASADPAAVAEVLAANAAFVASVRGDTGPIGPQGPAGAAGAPAPVPLTARCVVPEGGGRTRVSDCTFTSWRAADGSVITALP